MAILSVYLALGVKRVRVKGVISGMAVNCLFEYALCCDEVEYWTFKSYHQNSLSVINALPSPFSSAVHRTDSPPMRPRRKCSSADRVAAGVRHTWPKGRNKARPVVRGGMMRDLPGYEQSASLHGDMVCAHRVRDGHCVAIIILRFKANMQ
jgi:hypothetical protein